MQDVVDQLAAAAAALTAGLPKATPVFIVREGADRAAHRHRKVGPGFADQRIALAGQGARCSDTVALDRKAAALPEMGLLEVSSDH